MHRWSERARWLAIPAAAMLLGAAAPGASAGRDARPIRFEVAKIRFELNATDRDAGIQMFLDGEGWRHVVAYKPGGREILNVRGRSSIGHLGLTELFFESEEPSLAELPLEDLLRMFPEGRYRIVGRSAEGREMLGAAVLSHDIPDGPTIVSPVEDEVTDPANTVIDWDAVTEPQGIVIRGYEVIVEREDPNRSLDVLLPASVTSLTIPAEFLQPDVRYKLEVLAIARGGNQTITETTFRTAV